MYVNQSDSNVAIFTAVHQLWAEILNVQVEMKYIEWRNYAETIQRDKPAVFRFGWVADFNDPDNFMQVFRSGSDSNITGYSNPAYDRLIDRATQIKNPIERQELYIEAENLLCGEETIIIPLFQFTTKNE